MITNRTAKPGDLFVAETWSSKKQHLVLSKDAEQTLCGAGVVGKPRGFDPGLTYNLLHDAYCARCVRKVFPINTVEA